jgi:UDP-GlcNAc:undecaprenyl-phosphate GlcNAc-1-phosphate transferase
MAKGRSEGYRFQRWDPERKPTLGGITLYIVFLFCLSLSYGPYFDGSMENTSWMMALLGAASLAFLMGLSDDVHETRPLLKLAVQAGCGIIFVMSGIELELPAPSWVESSLTVLWVILLMNSFNMIDNMDGIAASIALTVLVGCLLRLWDHGPELLSLWPVLLGVLAAVIGFLRYNVHPSSMFLGDAGTQFLGLLLAFFGLRFFWTVGDPSISPDLLSILYKASALLLLFWSSLADTMTVFVLRLYRGASPLKGGKDHSTHAFSYAGWPERGVNLFYFLWSALNVSLALSVVATGVSIFSFGAVVAYILITFVALLLHTHRNYLKERKPIT